MRDDILLVTRSIIAEIAEIDEEKILDESDLFEDLGMDSMMALEILAAVENKFEIVIDESELVKFRNLIQVVKVIEDALADREKA